MWLGEVGDRRRCGLEIIKPWLQEDFFCRKELEEATFVQDTRTGALDLGIGQEFENKGWNDSLES